MTKINQLVVSKIQKRYIEIKNIGGSLMKLRNFLEKNVIKVVNAIALLLVVQTANSACFWVAHQPEFPESANKYKRMK